MKKIILLIVLVFFGATEGHSQSSLWSKTTEQRTAMLEKVARDASPKEFQLFQVNLDQLKLQFAKAPSRENAGSSPIVMSFPNPEGKLERFNVYESSVLAPELAKKHAEIQSYVAKGIDDPTASMSLSTTIFGFHGMVISAKGTYYIDPLTKDLNNYIVYSKANLATTRVRQCLVEDHEESLPVPQQALLASDSRFRTYRMAMACTIEYAAYHITAAGVGAADLPTRKAAVLAAMNVTVSRLNTVYEKDMALRMQLVSNNEDIIYVDSDNFNNTSATTLINQSQTVIDQVIGNANYDIGHTVSTGGGGLAQSPSVCVSTGKARGITGSPAPVGDPFDIDFVAHEVGHQFGASHTFNGEGGNCTALGSNPTRSAARAVEPGSGSTIMAYAGICSPVDVQSNSDDYFHAVSIAQMVAHISGAGNCVTGVANGNTPPVILGVVNYVIPSGTAFALKATATDADPEDAGALTYCWEQTNPGATTALPSATSTDSNPNFRSFDPTVSPVRYFPSLSTVLAGSLSSAWEVIPTVSRSMNFAVTVRDNRASNGGQTSRANSTVTFDASGTPFAVTSQNVDGISWLQGQSQTVTWNVGTTNVAPISTSNVNILLSTDGGLTYPHILVANTPNDGNQAVTVPAVSGLNCRIMVEPVGNVYFAINSKFFSIGYDCNVVTNATPLAIPDGVGSVSGAFAESVINIPATGSVQDIKVTVNITHPRVGNLRATLVHPDGSTVILFNRSCNAAIYANMGVTFQDGSPVVVCSSPLSGTYRAGTLANLNGKSVTGNWTLRLQDYSEGSIGNIDSWSINFGCTLGSDKFAGLTDFKLYPNPNRGNFTVQFDSKSSSDINIFVNDISGRQIFKRSYQNSGLFNEKLQLDNIQSGIYLVTVQDGDRKEVKKIVVE